MEGLVIYWGFLGQEYFGQDSLEDRLTLLSPEEWNGLVGLAPGKMRKASENVLNTSLSYDGLWTSQDDMINTFELHGRV